MPYKVITTRISYTLDSWAHTGDGGGGNHSKIGTCDDASGDNRKHITIQCHQLTECARVIDNPIIIYLFLVFVLAEAIVSPIPSILSSSLSNQHEPIESTNKSLRCQKLSRTSSHQSASPDAESIQLAFILFMRLASVIYYDKINTSRLMNWIDSIFGFIWMQTRLILANHDRNHTRRLLRGHWRMRSPPACSHRKFEIALFISGLDIFDICGNCQKQYKKLKKIKLNALKPCAFRWRSRRSSHFVLRFGACRSV